MTQSFNLLLTAKTPSYECNQIRNNFHMNLCEEEISRLKEIENLPPKKWFWPNTPSTGDHQEKIFQRCGAYDADYLNKSSRTFKIIRDSFDTHARAKNLGVIFVKGFIQDIVSFESVSKFNYVLILNSYRSWSHAELGDTDRETPKRLDHWLKKTSRERYLHRQFVATS
jgi:hypothetical protein